MSEVRFMKQNAQIQLTQPSPLSGRCRVVTLAEAFCGGMLRYGALLHRPSEERNRTCPGVHHIDSVILLTKPFSHVIIISKHG